MPILHTSRRGGGAGEVLLRDRLIFHRRLASCFLMFGKSERSKADVNALD